MEFAFLVIAVLVVFLSVAEHCLSVHISSSSGVRQTLLFVGHWVVVLILSFTTLGAMGACIIAVRESQEYIDLMNCLLVPLALCFTWDGCKRCSRLSTRDV